MSDSLIQFPAMVSGASFAGTCLMQTMMFTDCPLGSMMVCVRERWDGVPPPPFVRAGAKSKPLQESAAIASIDPGRIPNVTIVRCYFPAQRLKINAALVPPKPKELESAYSTSVLRATLGT